MMARTTAGSTAMTESSQTGQRGADQRGASPVWAGGNRPGLRSLALPVAIALGLVLSGCSAGEPAADESPGGQAAGSASAEAGADAVGDAEGSEDHAPQWPASNGSGLEPVDTVVDESITPKSVESNGHGLLITNNMMYSHNVTLFDAESRERVSSVSDVIDTAEHGLEDLPAEVSGAPVEAVWTDDGQYAYVSQYQVTDHGASAEDSCLNGEAITPSMVYRYSVEEQDWDQVIRVGRVPKYLALTPDETKLLVSNWCDQSLSVVDTATGEEIRQIPLNSMPRGIATLPDNRTAYATAMFADEVYRVDLETGESEVALRTGDRPRHLVMDEEGEDLYLVVTGANQLLKLDPETAEVLDEAQTGAEPRTMEISADGTALYVVNYNEDTVSKFDAETLEELDRQPTGHLPIGVTYDRATGQVWVANYSGSLSVFADTEDAAQAAAGDDGETAGAQSDDQDGAGEGRTGQDGS